MLHEPAGELEAALVKLKLEVADMMLEALAEVVQSRDFVLGELGSVQFGWLARDVDSEFPGLHGEPPFAWALRRVESRPSTCLYVGHLRSRVWVGGRGAHLPQALPVPRMPPSPRHFVEPRNRVGRIELFFFSGSGAESALMVRSRYQDGLRRVSNI